MRSLVVLPAAAFAPAGSAVAQVARFSTSDQTIMPDARTVLIECGHLPGDGLVIVRSVRRGRLDRLPLGQASVRAGEFANLRVRLSRPAEEGESLVVFLHADQGKRGVYDSDPVVLSVDISEPMVRAALLGAASRAATGEAR